MGAACEDNLPVFVLIILVLLRVFNARRNITVRHLGDKEGEQVKACAQNLKYQAMYVERVGNNRLDAVQPLRFQVRVLQTHGLVVLRKGWESIHCVPQNNKEDTHLRKKEPEHSRLPCYRVYSKRTPSVHQRNKEDMYMSSCLDHSSFRRVTFTCTYLPFSTFTPFHTQRIYRR